jgi:F420-0:gamma-glutamyl ligase-like protein
MVHNKRDDESNCWSNNLTVVVVIMNINTRGEYLNLIFTFIAFITARHLSGVAAIFCYLLDRLVQKRSICL